MNMITANKDIILTGFMGTGKSVVGISLAALLGRTFVDTDTEVERMAGKTIAALFEEDGEDSFRCLETAAIEELGRFKRGELVVATGGGAILREENRRALLDRGPIVLLCASPEEIYRRVGGSARPLLAGEDPYGRIVELLSRREPLYRSFAAVTVLTDGKTPEEIAREICAAIKVDL